MCGGGGEGKGEYLCPTNHTVRRDNRNDKTLGWPTQKIFFFFFNVSTVVGNKVTESVRVRVHNCGKPLKAIKQTNLPRELTSPPWTHSLVNSQLLLSGVAISCFLYNGNLMSV